MNEQLAAIKARREAVTPGNYFYRGQCIYSGMVLVCVIPIRDNAAADATFIAAAPADIDTLLAHVAALTAERDALAAQLAQAQRELAAVPVDAIRKMRFDAEVELHGYTNAELDAWLDAEQEAANAAAELRAPTYNGGCW